MTAAARRRLSLTTRWMILQAAALATATAAVGILQYRSLERALLTEIERAGRSVATAFAEVAEETPGFLASPDLQSIVLRFADRLPNVARVSVVNPAFRVVADSDVGRVGAYTDRRDEVGAALRGGRHAQFVVEDPRHDVLHIIAPLVGAYDRARGSDITGVMWFEFDLERAHADLRRTFARTSVALIGAFALGVAVLLRTGAMRDLERVARAADRLGAGDLSQRTGVTRGGEVGQLASAFDRMAERLQASERRAVKDMAALARSEGALRASEAQLREADALKSDFVSFVSHQLRTPLAGMNWMLELAEEVPDLPADAQEHIGDARQSADRLIALVNDLLDVSRLESGRVEVNPALVSLEDLTRSVLDEASGLLSAKGHTVVFDAAPALSEVVTDPQLIRQVILNLVSNAAKYTPDSGRIAVRITHEDECIVWTVTDNGIGIPKEAQGRLFEKFFRAPNAGSLETEGTGLGLSLARLIVERCGGRIWCESEVGRGSTFSFALPLAGAPVPEQV